MADESVWDDPELKMAGNYVQFENPGDKVMGRIDTIRKQVLTDPTTRLPKAVVQLILTCQDGEQRTVTAGQVRLLAILMEERPQVGDDIYIEFTKKESRGAGKTMKHWDVRIRRAQGHQAPPPAQQAQQPQYQPQYQAPPQQAPQYTPPPQQAPQYTPPPQADPWGQQGGQPAQPAQGDPWGTPQAQPAGDPWGNPNSNGEPPF